MQRRSSRHRVVAFFFLVLALAHLSPALTPLAYADDVADEAEHLFNLGTERYVANDFKGALQYFLASNRLVRNRNVMFNIARTSEHLREYAEAYRYYQRAGEGETDPGAKSRIAEALSRLSGRVALLDVRTDPPGASIYLNRKDLGDRGTSPQQIALTPGQYTVIAELAGYQDSVSQPIEVRVGAQRSVSLKLVRIVGTMQITGTTGAQVRVDTEDSTPICEIPCDVPVPPGQHTLIVSKAGYRQGRYGVQLKANTSTKLVADLAAETGSLVVNTDERDATISIDGKTQGFTPAVLQVPAGKHTVRVALRGFQSVERSVEVKTNEQTQLDLVLDTADSVEAASRVAEPIEDAPASVSLVSALELRGMHYPTVAEAVRGVRGVYVSEDRLYKNVGFRGFGLPGSYGNRVLVLVDGHPTNDNWVWSSFVGYDLRTDIEDIERIEVVRGPGSVLYGTGAFSGVINLITNGKDAPDGREIGVSVADEGVARARARITQHFGKDAGVWTSIAAGRSAGNDYFFPEYVGDGPASVAGNARDLDGFRVATWQGRTWYKELSAQWSFNTHDKSVPTGAYETIFGDPRTRQSDTRAFLEAKFEPKIGDTLVSTSRVHVNYYAYRGRFPRSPAEGGIERTVYDGAWIGAEQRFVFSPVPEVRLTGGGEAQYHAQAHQTTTNEVDGTVFDDARKFTLAAGYAMVDATPTKAIKVSAAARYDSYSTFGASLNPRFAFVVKPYEGGNVKVLAGKAFRAPSVYEIYYVAGGGQKASSGLEPENLYSGELEFSHRFSRTVIGTVSTYANYITNLIALRDLPDATPTIASYAYQNNNVPVGTLGAEAELRRDWKEGWMVSASYSFQKSNYLASRSLGELFTLSRAAGLREVPNAPNHIGSVRGGVPILGRALLLMNRITIEGPRWDRNDVEDPTLPQQTKTSPMFLWDIVLSGTETRWGLSYSLGVYNAFDNRWSVPLSAEFRQLTVRQNGRTFLATGAITF